MPADGSQPEAWEKCFPATSSKLPYPQPTSSHLDLAGSMPAPFSSFWIRSHFLR